MLNNEIGKMACLQSTKDLKRNKSFRHIAITKIIINAIVWIFESAGDLLEM